MTKRVTLSHAVSLPGSNRERFLLIFFSFLVATPPPAFRDAKQRVYQNIDYKNLNRMQQGKRTQFKNAKIQVPTISIVDVDVEDNFMTDSIGELIVNKICKLFSINLFDLSSSIAPF